MQNYLAATYYFDFEHANIQAIIAEFQNEQLTEREKAIHLYTKIRDGWRYDPYTLSIHPEPYRASNIAQRTSAHCIYKAVLLIAGLRALGIPARLHLAKVKNHLAVEQLTEKLGTNELSPHAMVDVFLNGTWLKVSPAFNSELCQYCRVAPLDFDGEHDSIFQQFTTDGLAFMEYLEDYGHFADVPLDFITKNWEDNYGDMGSRIPVGEQEFRLI
jgi:transglutaminase-like putative cysteine protease